MLESTSATGNSHVYDFGGRAYFPGLGGGEFR